MSDNKSRCSEKHWTESVILTQKRGAGGSWCRKQNQWRKSGCANTVALSFRRLIQEEEKPSASIHATLPPPRSSRPRARSASLYKKYMCGVSFRMNFKLRVNQERPDKKTFPCAPRGSTIRGFFALCIVWKLTGNNPVINHKKLEKAFCHLLEFHSLLNKLWWWVWSQKQLQQGLQRWMATSEASSNDHQKTKS